MAAPAGAAADFELDSVIQVTEFTAGNKREYAAISGNGQKIICRIFGQRIAAAGG
ncbi:MAG: hypothetical protein GF414_04360 [Candidatus Altiarchaeales archaeon]|nr:hypothetical protein [Candidatus Altiarchaeales archaeon]